MTTIESAVVRAFVTQADGRQGRGGEAAEFRARLDGDQAPVRFLLLSAAVEALEPECVTTFATEAEARTAFAKSQRDASIRGRWVELVRVGGRGRSAVVVWCGRPFPPVRESQIRSLVIE